jgi:hypothetical protein
MRTYTRKNTIKKYIDFLQNLQNEISNHKIKSLSNVIIKNNVSNDWSSFLRMHNIVFINNLGFYEWNKNVPISVKLVQTYRFHKREQNFKVKLKREQTQPKLQFDMNYIEIPAEIKAKARAESKTRATKVKVQEPINIPTQQNEYGVIRKFLKWLW